MELDDFYGHGIARGLVRYARTRPDWRLHGYGWMFRPLDDLEAWEGEGIISRVESAADADRLAAMGLPLVDVAGGYSRPGFYHVTNDDFLTGYKAAVNLRSRGFANFAFVGVSGVAWSEERKAGYLAALGRALGRAQGRAQGPGSGQTPDQAHSRSLLRTPGSPPAGEKGRARDLRDDDPSGAAAGRATIPSYERSLVWWKSAGASEALANGNRELGAFLEGLEKPAAIFACNDTAGLRLTEVCRRMGIKVPEEIAILGVDNEDILCELASPTLSSIMLDCENIGYRAGQLLDAILDGSGPPGGNRTTLPPREVAERESTRCLVCADPVVAKAATFIRTHAHEGILVSDILPVTGCSRRSLESRFRAALGHSLHDEILMSKLDMARRMLISSELPLHELALRCGFGSMQRFHAAFREAEGSTPGEWRRQGRNGSISTGMDMGRGQHRGEGFNAEPG